MKIILASVAAAISLAGCTSTGTNFDPVVAESIRPGMTTAEVVALLGPPNEISKRAGRLTFVWRHARVNLFTGRVSQARSVAFVFDRGRITREAEQPRSPGIGLESAMAPIRPAEM
jgi:hypothetical protein